MERNFATGTPHIKLAALGVVLTLLISACTGDAPVTVKATQSGTASTLALVAPLHVSPNPAVQGQQVQARYTVKNTGTQTLTVPNLFVGARDPSGSNVDFGYVRNLTLAPGKTYTYSATTSFSPVGTYRLWPVAYLGGAWVELGPSTSLVVEMKSACTPPYGTFRAGNWPPACWRPYTDTSPFNTPLPANPRIAQNSNSIVARVLGDISAQDRPNHLITKVAGTGGEPTYYSQPTDPEYSLRCTMTRWGNCPLEGLKVRISLGARVEANTAAKPTNSDAYMGQPDAHLTVVDQATGWEYDLWQVHRSPIRPQDGTTLSFSWGGRTRIDGDGRAGVGTATAARFGSLAGRLRVEELEAGKINHALFIVINCDSGTFVYPARASGRSCSAIGSSNVNAPPMGARFQLNMSAAEIDALPIQAWKKTLLHAMTKYGMFLGDTGAQGIFALEAEAGNQYSSLGHPDKWLAFGQQNWEPYDPDGPGPMPVEYVGKLYNRAPDPNPNFDWMKNVWSKLRVIDPCVSQRTC